MFKTGRDTCGWHFDDTVRNAQIFRNRWGFWPMHGWLKAFEHSGLLQIEEARLVVAPRD